MVVQRIPYAIYIYYCMTGRAIQGNIPFEVDHIGLTKGEGRYRGRERNTYPYCPARGITIIDLIYDFRVTTGMGTGNNEGGIRGNITL